MTPYIMLLIPLLPLAAGVIIGAFGRQLGENSSKVGVPAVALSCLVSIWALYSVSTGGAVSITVLPALSASQDWFRFGLYIDRLSAVMMVLITGVSTIIHLYSIRYFQGERGYARFYVLLGLITFVLLCMVASTNLFALFVFWQLMSWLLYLLLVYNYTHAPAVDAAFKTFIVHRLGDVAFLAGIMLAYRLYGTLEFPLLFTRAAEASVMFPLWPGGQPAISAVTVITLLIFVGAMAKSAQFPLHVWLPDTMDTPTPVSALMHAGIVNAGGFLLNRLAPLYGMSSTTLHVVFVIGGVSVLLGACMMLTQNDIKKTLGFSTMAQMGYMIMECGLGAFGLAIFHLIAHGLFKATLFLNAGHVIHATRREPKRPTLYTAAETAPFAGLSWVTGVSMTLMLPLVILLVAHDILEVPLEDAHGVAIFLFFSWMTASQIIFSLYRLRAVPSWKVSIAMVIALFAMVLTYLWAGESFTHFLYPAPGEVAGYLDAAALADWLFDVVVVTMTLLISMFWILLYTNARGQHILMPSWVSALQTRLYVVFMNRLWIDALYLKFGQGIIRMAQRLDARL